MTSSNKTVQKQSLNGSTKIDELLNKLYEGKDVNDELHEEVIKADYKVSDDLLAHFAKLGDETASKILKEKYIDIVRKETNNYVYRGYYAEGYDSDDLFQEAYISFLNSISNYKIEMQNRFRVFTSFVVKRSIKLLISKSRNLKQRVLNSSTSYNQTISNETDETFEDFLVDKNSTKPYELLEKEETLSEFWDKLSPFEKKVITYYADGYSYKSIGEILLKNIDCSKKRVKSVDNAIQRINKKRMLSFGR